MIDSLAIKAAKAATGLDWPETSVLLMDADGPRAEVEHVSARAIEIARACGATEIKVPKDDAERALMWKGRKSAFAAVGRISPNYMVEDGVIPRSEISRVLREIGSMAAAVGLRVANVFHAGDGNLHPLVLYDARVPGEEERAAKLGGDILRMCVRYGGSITGEHGVGAEKAAYMADMFGPDDLETMQRVRCAFDAPQLFNPGKVFPTTRLCGEQPGPYQPHPAEAAGLAERW
jgi:glycolate oxidase